MKILLAIDQIHPHSKSIVLAKQYMSQFNNSELTVLYVSNESASVYYKTERGIEHVLTDEALTHRNELELAVLAEFRPWQGSVQFHHEIGHPSKIICRAAKDLDAHLIILGGHRTRTNVLRIGSVVQGVLTHSDRPVLVAN